MRRPMDRRRKPRLHFPRVEAVGAGQQAIAPPRRRFDHVAVGPELFDPLPHRRAALPAARAHRLARDVPFRLAQGLRESGSSSKSPILHQNAHVHPLEGPRQCVIMIARGQFGAPRRPLPDRTSAAQKRRRCTLWIHVLYARFPFSWWLPWLLQAPSHGSGNEPGVLHAQPSETPVVRAALPGALDAAMGNPYLIADIAERVTPAVVYIEVTWPAPERSVAEPVANDPFFRLLFFFPFNPWPETPRPQISRGTGFIISEEGYILTNQHVVGNPGDGQTMRVKLTPPTSRARSKRRSSAPTTSWTWQCCKIEKPRGLDRLPTMPLGDSDASRPGEWVDRHRQPLRRAVRAHRHRGRPLRQGPRDRDLRPDRAALRRPTPT